MKAGYKLMLFLLLGGLVGLFFIKGPEGEPILSLSDFKPDVSIPDTQALMNQVDAIRANFADGADADSNTASYSASYYRWQDNEGNWQFGDRPPPGVNAELMTSNNISVVPAVEIRESPTASQQTDSRQPAENPLLPGNALNTLCQAADIEGQLQQSLEERKAAL